MNLSDAIAGYDPAQWEKIAGNLAHPRDKGGLGWGTLVKNRRTGMFMLSLGNSMRSVPPAWAKEIERSASLRGTIVAAAAGMTRYALTQAAKQWAPAITETAVGEYLDGRREMRSDRVEALLRALGLKVSK